MSELILKNLFPVIIKNHDKPVLYRVRDISSVTFVSDRGEGYEHRWTYEFYLGDESLANNEIICTFKTEQEAEKNRLELIKLIEAQNS